MSNTVDKTNLPDRSDWQMPITQLLFSFRGRINRARYWILTLPAVLALSLDAIYLPVGAVEPELGTLLFVFWLLVLWIMLAVSAKRLHDRDMFTWVLIPIFGLPFLVELARDILPDFAVLSALLGLINGLVGLWTFINLGCLRGTEGPNDYGPDPLQRDSGTPA